MNFEADIEQFISDLPNKIEQAKRQLFSGNLNALEFWHKRIGDFLMYSTSCGSISIDCFFKQPCC
jgi:hypothetical protein